MELASVPKALRHPPERRGPPPLLLDLPAAHQLLLYCVRVNPDEEALARIKELLQYPLDWNEVTAPTLFSSLAPLFHNLRKLGRKDLVPPQVIVL